MIVIRAARRQQDFGFESSEFILYFGLRVRYV